MRQSSGGEWKEGVFSDLREGMLKVGMWGQTPFHLGPVTRNLQGSGGSKGRTPSQMQVVHGTLTHRSPGCQFAPEALPGFPCKEVQAIQCQTDNGAPDTCSLPKKLMEAAYSLPGVVSYPFPHSPQIRSYLSDSLLYHLSLTVF